MTRPTLYDYFRSSASYRVRIGLNLKEIDYDQVKVDLAGGEQKGEDYRSENPQGFVPMLDIDGHRLTQSLAILDYLDAREDRNPFLPSDAADRAHVLALATLVACDIHPLNNLRVLKYLRGPLGCEEDAKDEWYRHWVREGFDALEALAAPRAGTWLFGDTPTLADICLVPQLYNARRFSVGIEDYPHLRRAEETASAHPAFAAAHPDKQEQNG